MGNICPKSCAGLATAAVFIAAGTAQLIAGLILLRSDYVYMLSGPDFWTASANISVGCLLGIVASIWKLPHRKKTVVVIARYNLIAALLASSITVNATTCTILVLSEASTLLSIKLEANGEYGNAATLNSEVLGYAYTASVITPALCIVLAVAALITKCCPTEVLKPKKLKRRKKKTPKKALCSHNPDGYQWVYTTHESVSKGDTSVQPATTPSSSSGSEFDSSLMGVSLAFSSPTPNRLASIMKPRVSFEAKDLNTPLPDFNDSELSAHSSFDVTLNTTPLSPMAGEVVPVQLGRTVSKRSYRIGLPVPIPVVSDHRSTETLVKTPVCPISSLKSPPECIRSPSERNFNFGKKRSSFTSFHDDKLRGDFLKHFPQMEPIRALHFREGRFAKLFPMDSITEDIAEDLRQKRNLQMATSPAQTSGYGSSPDVIIRSCSSIPAEVHQTVESVYEAEPVIKKSLFRSTTNIAENEDKQDIRL